MIKILCYNQSHPAPLKEKIMAIFTTTDFKDMLQTDMWVIEQIHFLPDNPPAKTSTMFDKETGITQHNVELVDDICMPARQEAVKQYKSNLYPMFFAITQKVYAELFHAFIGQNSLSSGNTPYDIEEKVKAVIANGTINSMIFTPVFVDRAEFDAWWLGEYHYEDLRYARNEIIHKHYTITGNRLRATHNGKVVLDWDIDTILDFSQRVLAKAQAICATATP